jgi:hypothetical protein
MQLRLLIVEDSEDDALLLVEALGRAGHELTFARVETEEELRAELGSRAWDAVLADYRLPHFSAPAALACLQETGIDLPFIVVSGKVGEAKAAEIMKAGAHDYVMKDNLARLMPAIEREVREAEVRRRRSEAEQKSHALMHLMESVLATIPSTIYVLDGELKVLMTNSGSRQGDGSQNLLGESIAHVLPAGLLETRSLRQRIDDVAARGGSHDLFDLRLPEKDGQERHLNVRVCAIQSASDPRETAEARRVLLVVDDVTRERALEDQMQQLAKLECIGQLAGGIAHDFNNVLTGIMGFTQLSLTDLPPDSPVVGNLEYVAQLAERGSDLTRQILAFSRRQPIQPVALNVNDLVKRLLKMMNQLIGENINLTFLPGEGLGNVMADPGQLEQVLMNLAVNARDAMPDGGTLVVETANAAFDKHYVSSHVGSRPGKYVLIAVTDSGCGMDQATAARVFEPFFTTKPKDKGTGLGLSTVYGIVKRHGGNIWAYSEPGIGTTFKVYLPLADTDAEPLEGPADAGRAARGNETILLVEDRSEVREVSRRALADLGYRVLTAASPSEAEGLFRTRAGEIDLLISDVILPECNGKALHERLRAQGLSVPALFMSGYTENIMGRDGILDASTPFIQKPFTIVSLAQKVRETLNKSAGGAVSGPRETQ